MGLPRVLADEHRHLGTLVVTGGVALRSTEKLTVDPELAGLLLRQRARTVARAEHAARGLGQAGASLVDGGLFRPVPAELPLLRYYANAIAGAPRA